jgi:hypothetical protein
MTPNRKVLAPEPWRCTRRLARPAPRGVRGRKRRPGSRDPAAAGACRLAAPALTMAASPCRLRAAGPAGGHGIDAGQDLRLRVTPAGMVTSGRHRGCATVRAANARLAPGLSATASLAINAMPGYLGLFVYAPFIILLVIMPHNGCKLACVTPGTGAPQE